MKGRKPVPAEVKRQTGNRGKRTIGDPVNVGPRLTATDDDFHDPEIDDLSEPADDEAAEQTGDGGEVELWVPPVPDTLLLVDELDDETAATDLWNKVCRLLITSNIITEGDLFAVEQFVMATLEARRAFFELRTEGSTVTTANPAGGRASKTTHPAYRVWRDANTVMFKWAEHLGLSPVARARLGLAVGHGRKLAQELEADLPANPLNRGSSSIDGSADEIDPYEET